MYCQADKTIRMTAPYGKRMEGCPLVALPEHGDLKDETDIIHRIEKIADADLAQDIIGEILASPTIVEATE